jgi:hypothetical protein
MTPTDALLQHFLMYLVVPFWLLADLADATGRRISSAPVASANRCAVAPEVGVPLLAALLLEINAAVLLIILTGLVHQRTAV